LIKRLSSDPVLKEFVLVGGTALSLQLGYRKSIDIDLFSAKPFDAKAMREYLKEHYQGVDMGVLGNAVFSRIQGVKVDMIAHQYPWVDPVKEMEGIRMASTLEIGAMKMNAISNSGERLKDFIDMHFLLENHSLEQFTNAYAAKYKDANPNIAKNALLYHDQIDFAGDIHLLNRKFNWPDIAKRLRMAVANPKKVFPTIKSDSRLERNQRLEGPKQKKGRRR